MREKRNVLTYLGEKEWLILFLWFGLAFIGTITEIGRGNMNNYYIFKQVFFHVIHQQPLYVEYPKEYFDINHYGPVFSFVIAPFAGLDDRIGSLLFALAGAAAMYYAIRQLPITRVQQNIVMLFCSQELMGASGWFQFNQFSCALIMLTFTSILKGKDFWAAFCIVIGTLVKIYGIVGLGFIFFSRNPKRFIAGLFIWGAILFALPMIISSPAYIIQTYVDWYVELVHKNAQNQTTTFQDLSAGGFIKRVFHMPWLSNTFVLIPLALLYASQYLLLKYRYNSRYRLYLLCTTLMFPVLASTSSESPTYIIAIPAICIWYVMQNIKWWHHVFIVLAILLVSFSHSDILTPWFRHNVAVPYAVKAFPCLVLYLIIIYQIWTRQFLLLRTPPSSAMAPKMEPAAHL
ncbi:glycosyltransferase family 87 protein [Chitinophaga vietnamensis]|uniref:glycosyltransferase family 87 protein n=1 Tax=Chitinophaga vietnamensis TaxID=2593957 RepID=UPI001177DCEB|nr:glycosyltransferase family 87 protein [Chitinophaga vietnamensis]